MSVRPDSVSGSLPGSSVTVQDNVTWHSCLFCSFSTASMELMALHLQANHLGKAQQQQQLQLQQQQQQQQQQRSDVANALLGEGATATSTHHHSSNAKSSGLSDREEERNGEKSIVGGWNNHMDLSHNPFQNDFYRQFSGLYDGSPRTNQGLQGYGGGAADQGKDLAMPALGGASLAEDDDRVSDKASCGEAEEERAGSEYEAHKAVDCGGGGEAGAGLTPSATPERQQQHQNHSEEDDDEDEEEEAAVEDEDGDEDEEEEEEEEEDRNPDGRAVEMEREADGSGSNHLSQRFPKQHQGRDSPRSPTLSQRSGGNNGGGLASSASMVQHSSLFPQSSQQAGQAGKQQWPQGLGLPPGLLKSEAQSHMEQQQMNLNMLSVLRAYSNDNMGPFNGLGGVGGGGGGGGGLALGEAMNRQDTPGEFFFCVFSLWFLFYCLFLIPSQTHLNVTTHAQRALYAVHKIIDPHSIMTSHSSHLPPLHTRRCTHTHTHTHAHTHANRKPEKII